MTYTFTASTPGTHSYYSGTQGDLQVEMGLYGAFIVLPKTIPSASALRGLHCRPICTAEVHWGEADFRLAAAAYNHPKPATTASTSSSSPRSIPRFTRRRWRRLLPSTRHALPERRAAVSTFRPSHTIRRTS